ncbi:MAG TPA: hypothetical protein VE685_14030 [Thermoanaerobaculia bacterium]|nr:hypothetical protein [Thermoanaerobaculia bacterium]
MKEKTSSRKTEPYDPLPPDPDRRGWNALAGWLAQPAPEEAPPLAAVRELEPLQSLLHALAGRSARGFLIRSAVLEALVQSTRPGFSQEDLDRALDWLTGPVRKEVIQQLHQVGWLGFDPDAGHFLTEAGRCVYEMLAFLRQLLLEGNSLPPAIRVVRLALDGGLDPLGPLQSLRLRLLGLRQEIDSAMATYSEAVLRRTAERIGSNLKHSDEIRTLLDMVQDLSAAREVAGEIRTLLARVHGASAWLAAAIEEVRRQSVPLEAGLTLEDIFQEAARRSREELAAVGRAALLPVFIPPPLVQTEALIRVAMSRLPLSALRPPEEPES